MYQTEQTENSTACNRINRIFLVSYTYTHPQQTIAAKQTKGWNKNEKFRNNTTYALCQSKKKTKKKIKLHLRMHYIKNPKFYCYVLGNLKWSKKEIWTEANGNKFSRSLSFMELPDWKKLQKARALTRVTAPNEAVIKFKDRNVK